MKNIIINKDLDIKIKEHESSFRFEIKEGESFVTLTDFLSENALEIDVKENSILHLSLLANSKIDKLEINANLAANSRLIVYFADFSHESNNCNVAVNLNDVNANLEWHLASLSSNNDKKMISVSAIHNSPQTFARVDNYGVVKDSSKLVFSGISHILNGSVGSKTHQNAKIMVFDPHSDAVAKPILKIDENDIEASHAAVVGKISDEHLFYLTSRGLSLDDAKMLITLGYLKPIFKGFNEEKVNEINEIIGGRL